jgi:hypothetical protein
VIFVFHISPFYALNGLQNGHPMPEEETSQNVGREPEGEPTPRPPRQPPGNQNPPAPPAEGDTNDNGDEAEQLREIKAGERILIGIGIATILVNLGIWHTYSGQLDQMRIATEAATRAANAASDSLELNQGNFDRMMLRTIDQTAAQIQSAKAAKDAVAQAQKSLQGTVDNFHQEQRPWVGLSPTRIAPTGVISYSNDIYVINTGKTPALNVSALQGSYFYATGYVPNERDAIWMEKILRLTREHHFGDKIRIEWFGQPDKFDFIDPSLRPPGPTPSMGVVDVPGTHSLGVLTPAIPYVMPLPGGQAIGATEIVFGQITYQAVGSSKIHETTFCIYYTTQPFHFQGGVVGPRETPTPIACPVFNNMN